MGVYYLLMSQPRFYCRELTPGVVTLDENESRHGLQSLRLRPGDEVVLFDGRGRLAHGVLRPADDDRAPKTRRAGAAKASVATFMVERVLCEPPPARTLTLIVAGCKGSRLTWMIEKLTELGVTGITVAAFQHSVVRVGPAYTKKLRRTALEAAKQSRRVWLPEIDCGVELAEALAKHGGDKLLIAHPVEEAVPLSYRLQTYELTDRHVTAIVGPEGGLSEAEVELLRDVGGELVRLAPTILRVETAAVSVAANWAAHLPG